MLKQKIALKDLIFKVLNLLMGFFFASVLSTLPSQTGDWTILGASIIVSIIEYLSQCFYTSTVKPSANNYYFAILNDFKIGVTYGLFIDSFKLGS